MPKVVYKTDATGRGFISAILAPVRCRQEPKFGVRRVMWAVALTFGTIALLRLLLAQ